MRHNRFILILFSAIAIISSCRKEDTPIPEPIDLTQRMGKGELFDKLKDIKGVSNIQAVNGQFHSNAFDEEYQFFIEQNIDPKNPSVGTFKQKIRIGHYDFSQPLVLVTDGYGLEDKDSLYICNKASYKETLITDDLYEGEEIARHFKANMLVVEHRYFYTSNPDVRDWTYLTTKNASADLHHIFKTFKPVYNKPWISTGVSKGGMTTMFYHFMYPDDVEICVPYVAPMCYSLADDRVIFIYGSTDFWTGCGINDVWKTVRQDRVKYPTFGFDTKEKMSYHLAKDKGHTALIQDLEPSEAQEIWNKIDKWLTLSEDK